MPPLENRVAVWIVRQDSAPVRAGLASYHRLLTGEERQRAARFLQGPDRERFVLGRALARTMLSRFGGAPALTWRIVVDPHGRPHLAGGPDGLPDFRFNLSHTSGLVACALTIGREVGVDVEDIHRRLVHERIPERFFSAREVADLRALPPAEQRVKFFDYWTLKEAYIKARGLGLALPLGQFSFVCRGAAAPMIAFGPELDDDPASWQFAQFWPTDTHRMAVAVRRRGRDLPIDVSDVIPEVAE